MSKKDRCDDKYDKDDKYKHDRDDDCDRDDRCDKYDRDGVVWCIDYGNSK